MRSRLTIPDALRDAVARSLLTLYAVKADAIHHAASARLDGEVSTEVLLDHRRELLAIDELLDQLDWVRPPAGAAEISGEREILKEAVVGAILSIVERLDHGCHGYVEGGPDVDDLVRQTKLTHGLIELFVRIERSTV